MSKMTTRVLGLIILLSLPFSSHADPQAGRNKMMGEGDCMFDVLSDIKNNEIIAKYVTKNEVNALVAQGYGYCDIKIMLKAFVLKSMSKN